MTKKFNGFKDAKTYKSVLATVKNIVKNYDDYDRDTIAVYADENDDLVYFQVVLDNYVLNVEPDGIEIDCSKCSSPIVDFGIVNVAAKIKAAAEGTDDEYDFDEFFDNL